MAKTFVCCDLCDSMLELEDIPEDTDSDEWEEYLHNLVNEGEIGGWKFDDFGIEVTKKSGLTGVTIICSWCMPSHNDKSVAEILRVIDQKIDEAMDGGDAEDFKHVISFMQSRLGEISSLVYTVAEKLGISLGE